MVLLSFWYAKYGPYPSCQCGAILKEGQYMYVAVRELGALFNLFSEYNITVRFIKPCRNPVYYCTGAR